MRSYIRIFFFIIIAGLFSCEEQGWIVTCSDCTEEEPKEAILQINIDNSYYKKLKWVKVYEGDLEDNVLLKQLNTLFGNQQIQVTVTLNKKYTVTGEYEIEKATYISVDSAFPRIKYDRDQCDNPCYFVYDTRINLKIKYD